MFRALALALILLLAPLSSARGTSIYSLVTAVDYLNAYYGEMFAFAGLPYEKPTVLILEEGERYTGDCGIAVDLPEQIDHLAFYCPLDQTIVLEEQWMRALAAEQDDFMPMFVLAHEYGHHAQYSAGLDREVYPKDGDFDDVYSIELELMADCLGGAWAAHLNGQGKLDLSDIAAVVGGIDEWGDKWSSPKGPGAHGSGAQRVQAVMLGYTMGSIGCMALNPLPRVR